MSCRSYALVVSLILLCAGSALGQHVEATVEVGNAPSALVYDSLDQKIFVANKGSKTVSVIDATSNEVIATIPTGDQPSAVCWNSTSNKVYVANDVLGSPGSVTIIDAATDSVIITLDVGQAPNGLAWSSNRNKVYCTNRDASTVTVIDGQNDVVLGTVHLSQTLNNILYNPVSDRIYVCSGAYGQPGKVHVIDCSDDQVLTSFNSGTNAWAMAYSPTSNWLYVANAGSQNMSIFDCSNHQNLGMLRTGEEPKCVAWTSQNKVFCGSYWGQQIHYMHGDSLRFKGKTAIPGNPENLLYNPETQKLFVALPLQSLVTVLDARDQHEHQIIVNIDAGGGPKSMVLHPDQNRVYVANSWDNIVTVIKDVVGIAETPHNDESVGPVSIHTWPTPTRTARQVMFSATGFNPKRLEIRNVSGRLVHASSASRKNIWTTPSSSGIYFYTLTDGDREVTGKLVVE